jgi:phosphoglycerate dehydrogenase-like enzyme
MSGVVTVGLGYPPEWDVRPEEMKAADLVALAAIDGLGSVDGAQGSGGGGTRLEIVSMPDEALAEAEVVLTMHLPDGYLSRAPALKWVHAIGAGVTHLPLADLAAAGVRLSTSSGINAVPVAEFAFARMMAHHKRHRDLDTLQTAHDWRPTFGADLAGTTLAVLGLGAIGQAVAVRAAAFGMRVIGLRRSVGEVAGVDEVCGPDRLHEVLRRAESVIACLPGTAETEGLMDAAAFAAMPRGAFFCNVGRGSLVDEDALLQALASGHLGGAALDVTVHEPLPSDSPLWDAPNLCLSPHSASSATTHFTGVHRLFRENLARYVAGRPLLNEINPTQGY